MAEENGWVVFAQVASPIVALALGVVGVWNEKIKNRLFGPSLELEVHEPEGHLTHTMDGEVRRYYLVKVKNASRRDTAHSVRLRLVELWSIDKSGNKENRSPSMPLQLLSSVNGPDSKIDITTYDCYNIGFIGKYTEGCFIIQDAWDMLFLGTQIESRETVKFGLEIQADNLPPSEPKYLMLAWRENQPTQKCPWSAVPVLSLAD